MILVILSASILINYPSKVKCQTRILCYQVASCEGMASQSRMISACCNAPQVGGISPGYSYRVARQALGPCRTCPNVIGFNETNYRKTESTKSFSITIGYISGLRSSVTLIVSIIRSNAGSNDVRLLGTSNDKITVNLSPDNPSAMFSIEHVLDKVAQEMDERYVLRVENANTLPGIMFQEVAGTIVDATIVNFYFQEPEYIQTENHHATITATLWKNTTIVLANAVTLKVCPITIVEARNRRLQIPMAAQLENDPNSPYEAIEADFNITCFTTGFDPDENDEQIQSVDLKIGIVDDNINERMEQKFLITVRINKSINSNTINLDRVTVGVIRDNDPITIGFNQSSYTIKKFNQLVVNNGMNLYLLKNRPSEQTFQVQLTPILGTAIAGLDYSIPSLVLFTSKNTIVPIKVTILTDFEDKESKEFSLISSFTGSIEFDYPSPNTMHIFRITNITIQDTDKLTFSFTLETYSEHEGNDVAIYANLTSGPPSIMLTENINLQVCPIPPRTGQALPGYTNLVSNPFSPYEANDADFDTTCVNITLEAFKSAQHFRIKIDVIDDSINERYAQLFLIIAQIVEMDFKVYSVLNNTNATTIGIILDNDPIAIGFNQSSFIFHEPYNTLEEIQLFLVRNTTTEQTFRVKISIFNGTATSGLDYSVDSIVTITPEEKTVPVTFTIFSDNIKEGTEKVNLISSFIGDIQYSYPSSLDKNIFRSTTIWIIDNYKSHQLEILRSIKLNVAFSFIITLSIYIIE